MGGRVIDLSGQRFGRLFVVEQRGYHEKGAQWLCRCDCGREKVIPSSWMRSGRVVSCGCRNEQIRAEVRAGTRKPKLRHGHGRHGRGVTPSITYSSWCSMKERCNNPASRSYADYGGRGIEICQRWLRSFENFLADMGERPAGKSLDRINPNGDYEPGNCRWATPREQGANQRRGARRIGTVLARFEREALTDGERALLARVRREILGGDGA